MLRYRGFESNNKPLIWMIWFGPLSIPIKIIRFIHFTGIALVNWFFINIVPTSNMFLSIQLTKIINDS